jgi:repressor LexA
MLTIAEQKTYQFIKKYMAAYHHSPTTAEIAEGIGIISRGVVHRYLRALEKKGFIQLLPKRHRNIVLKELQEQRGIPLVGCIAAGSPIEAVEQNETIDVVSIFLGQDRFALKVKGDSMLEDGIFDGDIIICERAQGAADGQIVVALIDKQEATLKRLYRNNDRTVTLLPANPQHQAQTYDSERVEIQGLYIGLLRLT